MAKEGMSKRPKKKVQAKPAQIPGAPTQAWFFTLYPPQEKDAFGEPNGTMILNLMSQFFQSPLVCVKPGIAEKFAQKAEWKDMLDMNVDFSNDDLLFITAQLELSAKGCPHIQGTLKFKEPCRKAEAYKRMDIFGAYETTHTVHVEETRNEIASRNYCRKTEPPGGRIPGTRLLDKDFVSHEMSLEELIGFGEDGDGGESAAGNVIMPSEIPMPTRESVAEVQETKTEKMKRKRAEESGEVQRRIIDMMEKVAEKRGLLIDVVQMAMAEFTVAHSAYRADPKNPKKFDEFCIAQRVQNKIQTGKMEMMFEAIEGKRQKRLREENIVELRDVSVVVMEGPAGTGKSWMAIVGYNHLGVFVANCNDDWPFSGYKGEAVLVLEDFHGTPENASKGALKAGDMQRLLDVYELRLNGKMATHRQAQFTLVVITTNKPFDEWFGNWWGISDKVKESIRSRITKWRKIEGDDKRAAAQKTKTVPLTKETQVKFVYYRTPDVSSSTVPLTAAVSPTTPSNPLVEENPTTGLFSN